MHSGTPDETITVSVSQHFAAPAEKIFDAWLDPVAARHWFFATPDGEMIRAEIDPQVGGEFCFLDRRDDEDIEHFGEYLEIDRPRRLVFDFSVNQSPVSRVQVDIAPLGGGQNCELTLTHEMPAQFAVHAERAKKGWAMMLDGLARAV